MPGLFAWAAHRKSENSYHISSDDFAKGATGWWLVRIEGQLPVLSTDF